MNKTLRTFCFFSVLSAVFVAAVFVPQHADARQELPGRTGESAEPDGNPGETDQPSSRGSSAELSGVGLFGAGTVPGEKRTLTVNGVDYTFCWCPPGEFMMGSPDSEPERMGGNLERQHLVRLTRGFWMLETEVTQLMWKSVMGRTIHDQACEQDPLTALVGTKPQNPVYNVSWDEAAEFCVRLGALTDLPVTLPTEAQWEYACRAGTTTAVYSGALTDIESGQIPELDAIAWHGGNSDIGYDEAGSGETAWDLPVGQSGPFGTHAVKGKVPNAWGLYDMIGNVGEWCIDWVDPEMFEGEPDSRPAAAAAETDPAGADRGVFRAFRGGSWYERPSACRAAARSFFEPSFQTNMIGFRPVIVPAAKQPGSAGSGRAGRIGTGSYAGEKRLLNVHGIDYLLTWCPPGEFMMGSPESEETQWSQLSEETRPDNEQEHPVRLSRGFWMLTTEVTQEMWQNVMGTTLDQQRVKAGSTQHVPARTGDPIYFVSWDEARDFCRRLGALAECRITLPTEAQWEYACRFGSDVSAAEAGAFAGGCWNAANSGGSVRPAGGLLANLWGLYDMRGNVWEWCSDWYLAEYYTRSPRVDPSGPSAGTSRVRRGGAWSSPDENCRPTIRSWAKPSERSDIMGFRFILVP